MNASDAKHLRMAIGLSRAASARGDEPSGAVLVDGEGRVVAAAGNTQHTARDVGPRGPAVFTGFVNAAGADRWPPLAEEKRLHAPAAG